MQASDPIHFEPRRRAPWVILWHKSGPEAHTHLPRGLNAALQLAPRARILVPVLEQDSPWWGPVLREHPQENVAEQPFDRGTGNSILLALSRLQAKDPHAEVVLLRARPDAEQALPSIRRCLEEAHDPQQPATVVPGASGDPMAVCGDVSAILRLFQRTQASTTEAFLRGGGVHHPRAVDALYPFLPAIDFTHDVYAAARDQCSISVDLPVEAQSA